MPLISPHLTRHFNAVADSAIATMHRHAQADMSEELAALSHAVSPDERRDSYGSGGVVSAFEDELATLFGKSACVFLPTGTLAQCAAMKCYADASGRNRIGLHPTSHLLLHEHNAIEELWQLKAAPCGTFNRVFGVADVKKLNPQHTAAVILELPMREIGGALPSWNELLAIRAWCSRHEVKMHLDGARVWQVTPYYERDLPDIAALFDSVYVSFYKDLGGIFGAALLGTESLIAQTKVWARRAGGNPITQYVEVIAAREGLAKYLPCMAQYVAYTRELATALSSLPVSLAPATPQAAMFHLHFGMPPETLAQKIVRYAEQTGVLVLPLPRAGDATSCVCEVSVGSNAVSQPTEYWKAHLAACLAE
ncbi:beta-eliminating lyase-related protein [Alteromonas sp. ASW11-19]|uniref:Beta-eliminating lyase-related protein n=1 Tax=Alteromonas salexigens TaxID=2982530 RepID=A0ABT2VSX5_9ALTE|nr:beta-eliminating lyase-related protein [Alteromonas salexigens]MCU7556028.1 beta-eliminating lyase-related protein [Alteromonas salexigens]